MWIFSPCIFSFSWWIFFKWESSATFLLLFFIVHATNSNNGYYLLFKEEFLLLTIAHVFYILEVVYFDIDNSLFVCAIYQNQTLYNSLCNEGILHYTTLEIGEKLVWVQCTFTFCFTFLQISSSTTILYLAGLLLLVVLLFDFGDAQLQRRRNTRRSQVITIIINMYCQPPCIFVVKLDHIFSMSKLLFSNCTVWKMWWKLIVYDIWSVYQLI